MSTEQIAKADQGASLDIAAALSLRVTELNLEVLETKTQLAETKLQVALKNEELESLKRQLHQKEATKFVENAYWVRRGTAWDGPFCQICYEVGNRLAHLVKLHPTANRPDSRHCVCCRNTFDNVKII
jgi:hypothetical protein